jgi:hypothetical protein
VQSVVVPLVINGISDVLALVAATTWRILRKQLAGRRRVLGLIPVFAAGILWVVASGAAAIIAHKHELLGFVLLVCSGLLCTAAATAPYLNLWRVGLVGADVQTKRGITATESLKLCTSDLKFLGTGGTKLTRSDEFEGAVARCTSSGNTVRMLLSKPDAENLITAAKLAAKPQDEYKTTLVASLRVVAEMREKRGGLIAVRFYNGVSPFRLMFINDRLCVFAYNVYGTADETTYPQVLIASNFNDKRRSYYWGMEKYFDRAWDSAADSEWDFKEYL